MKRKQEIILIAKSVAHVWVRDAVSILRGGGKPKRLSTYNRSDILEILDVLSERDDLPKIEIGNQWIELRDLAVESAEILIWAKQND